MKSKKNKKADVLFCTIGQMNSLARENEALKAQVAHLRIENKQLHKELKRMNEAMGVEG